MPFIVIIFYNFLFNTHDTGIPSLWGTKGNKKNRKKRSESKVRETDRQNKRQIACLRLKVGNEKENQN